MEPNKPWPDQGKIQDPRGKKNGLKSTALRERKATIFHSHTKGERYVHWLCKKDVQADAASWASFSLSKPCQVAPIIAAMLIDADKKKLQRVCEVTDFKSEVKVDLRDYLGGRNGLRG